jgi:hypothetical protein
MSASASIFSDFWQDQLVSHHRQALFIVLVSFLFSFGFIRFSSRMGRSSRFEWWPGSVVSDSGVHLHHLVWGIWLMIGGGVLGFALFESDGWRELSAAVFGIGAGFTIDEFALWVYLDDVYWAEEGRSSIDAAVIAAALMVMVLVGARPIEIGTDSASEVIFGGLLMLVLLLLVGTCFAKHRLVHGAIGFFLWPLAIYGAARLGKPGSTYAKRWYGERRPKKQAKAERRFSPSRRTERFKERVRDWIGGETNEVYRAKLAEAAATEQAVAEIRQRAAHVAAAEHVAAVESEHASRVPRAPIEP